MRPDPHGDRPRYSASSGWFSQRPSKRVHADFLAEYGLSADETPLVIYDYKTGEFSL